MADLIFTAKKQVENSITAAAASAFGISDPAPFIVEIPADRSHGDLASNAAMLWAKQLRMAPRAIAEALLGAMDFGGTYIERAEIAGCVFRVFG